MPGRYSIGVEEEDLRKRYSAEVSKDYRHRYNISPTQKIPIIANDNPGVVTFARWGFIRPWSKEAIVNARSEGIEKNRVFGKAFAERRCIIPADAYYEWAHTKEGKLPHRIMLKDSAIFSMAGVWEEIEGEKYVATITVEPNQLIRKIHDRMPAILRKDDEKKWLESADLNLIQTYDENKMMMYEISTDINSSRHDRKELVKPSSQKKLDAFA